MKPFLIICISIWLLWSVVEGQNFQVSFDKLEFIVEEGKFFNVKVNSRGNLVSDVTIVLQIENGEDDFNGVSRPITFLKGFLNQESATVTFLVNDDTIPETNETFALTIKVIKGQAQIEGPRSARIVILSNDDFGGVFSIANTNLDVIMDEPESASVSAEITVSIKRDRGSFGEVTLLLRVTGESPEALPGLDISPVERQISFAENSLTASVKFTILEDNIPELDESFKITLSIISGSGRMNEERSVLNVIVSANDAPVRFTLTSNSVLEKEADYALNLVVTRGLSEDGLTRVGPLEGNSSVAYEIIPGTAKFGEDYRGVNSTLIFGPGITYQFITIEILADNNPEEDEQFVIKLKSAVGDATLESPRELIVSIIGNDDQNGVIQLSQSNNGTMISVSVNEDDLGSIPVLRISRVGGTFKRVTMNWILTRVEDNFNRGESNQSISDDIAPTSGTVTFDSGQSTAVIIWTVLRDTKPEPVERFHFHLLPQTVTGGARAGSPLEATIRIEDSDDAYGVVGFADSNKQFLRTNLQKRQLVLTLTRSGGYLGEVNIVLDLEYSAGNISDMILETLPLRRTFSLQQSELPVVVSFKESTFLMAAATFTARLATVSLKDTTIAAYNSPRIAQRFQTSVMVKIDEADSFIGFASTLSITVEEPEGKLPAVLPLRVTRDGISKQADVTWKLISEYQFGHTNITSEDVSPMSGQLTLKKGESSKDILLQILPDDWPETSESFTIVLLSTNEQNTQRIRNNAAMVKITISSNDKPGGVFQFASFMQNHYTLEENLNSLNVTVVRIGSALIEHDVEYVLLSGNNTDQTSIQGEREFYGARLAMHFEVGQTSASGSILAKADDIPEIDEYFSVRLFILGSKNPADIGDKKIFYLTIPANDDPYGIIDFSYKTLIARMGESKANSPQFVNIHLVRSRGLFRQVNVSFRIEPITNVDLTPNEGFVVFNEGVSEQILTISSLPDNIPEDEERFVLQLQEAHGGATLGENRTVEIFVEANDYPVFFTAPLIRTVKEGSTLTVTIERTQNLGQLISISYRTVDGIAKSGEDYKNLRGTVNFAAWETKKNIQVEIINDVIAEGPENFFIELYNPIGDAVTFLNGSMELIIASNDQAGGVFRFANIDKRQSKEGTFLSIDVIRFGGHFLQASIFWRIVNNQTGLPIEREEDVNPPYGYLQLEIGQKSQAIVLEVLSDNIPELEEVFLLELVNITGNSETISQTSLSNNSEYLVLPITISSNDDPQGVLKFPTFSSQRRIAEDLPTEETSTYTITTNFSVERARGQYGQIKAVWLALNLESSNIPRLLDLLFLGMSGPDVTIGNSSYRQPGTGTNVYRFLSSAGSFSSLPRTEPTSLTREELADGYSLSGCLRFDQKTAGNLVSKHLGTRESTVFGLKLEAELSTTKFEYSYLDDDKKFSTKAIAFQKSIVDNDWHCFFINVQTNSVQLFLDDQQSNSILINRKSISDNEGQWIVGTSPQQNSVAGYFQDFRLYAEAVGKAERNELLTNAAKSDVKQISGYIQFNESQRMTEFEMTSSDDTIIEADELFAVKLLSVRGGAQLANSDTTATLTITKSDYANGLFSFKNSFCTPVPLTEASNISCPVERLYGAFDSVTVHWQINWAPNSGALVEPPIESQFRNASGSITFPPGIRELMINFSSVDDMDPEPTQTFEIKLITAVSADGEIGSTNYSGAAIDMKKSNLSFSIPINDYLYGLLQFSPTNDINGEQIIRPLTERPEIKVPEETSTVTITIARAQGTEKEVSAEWRTRDGTAKSLGPRPDYKADGGRVTFAAGKRLAQVAVQIFDNNVPEDEKYFELELLNPIFGAQLGPGSILRVVIEASDEAYGVFSFSNNSRSVTLEETQGSIARLEVNREGGTFRDVLVSWSLKNESINDLKPLSGTLQFLAKQKKGIISIDVIQDKVPELLESYQITLNNASLGRIDHSNNSARINIKSNEDPFGVFVIDPADRAISIQESIGNFRVRILRQAGSLGTIKVSYKTRSSPIKKPHNRRLADENQDYIPVDSSVLFADGQLYADVTILVVNDLLPETFEDFFFQILNVTLTTESLADGVSIPRLGPSNETYSVITILPNDDANGVVELSASEITVNESDSGAFLYLVRREGQFGEITVEFEVTAISTIAEFDYSVLSKDVVLPDGSASVEIPIYIVDDTVPEMEEKFRVTIKRVLRGGARLGDVKSSLITILSSDDPLGIFEFITKGITVEEPIETPQTIPVTVTRIGGRMGVVGIRWEARLNGDTDVTDITPSSGDLYFVTDEGSKQLQIQVLPDDIPEDTESIEITLISISDLARLGERRSFILTILANDMPFGSLQFTADNILVEERATPSIYEIKIQRSGGLFQSLIVEYEVKDSNIVQYVNAQGRQATFFFINPLNGVPAVVGTAVDVLSSSSPLQSCGGACLQSRSCRAFLYDSEGNKCFLYRNSDPANLSAKASAKYYTKDLGKTAPIYEKFADSEQLDFQPYRSTSAVLPAGVESPTIPVEILPDDLPELAEEFTICLIGVKLESGPPADVRNRPTLGTKKCRSVIITLSDNAMGTFKIYSPDPNALFSGSVIPVLEQRSLAVELVIDRVGGSIGRVSVEWYINVTQTNATKNFDYKADGAVISFQPAETRKAFTVAIEEDNIPENDESIVIGLRESTGGADISPTQSEVTVIIMANDFVAGIVSMITKRAVGQEGGQINLELYRSSPGLGVIHVDWEISVNTANEKQKQFKENRGRVTFNQNQLYKQITLQIIDDDIPESYQSFVVTLTNITTEYIRRTGWAIIDPQNSQATVLIDPSDTPHGLFSVAESTSRLRVTENNTTLSINVLRAQGAVGIVNVSYEIIKNLTLDANTEMANRDEDFQIEGDFVIFQDGQKTGSINVQIVDDTVAELDELVVIRLISVTLLEDRPTPGDVQIIPPELSNKNLEATIIIDANDGTKGIAQFDAKSANLRTEEDRKIVRLTVLRNQGTYGSVSVFYFSQLVTAQNEDFEATSGTIFFGQGENQKSIEILIYDDTIPEPDEVFQIVLANPQNGLLLGTPSKANITIANSDGAGGFIEFASGSEILLDELEWDNSTSALPPMHSSGGLPTAVNITIRRGPGYFGDVSVDFTIKDVTDRSRSVIDLTPSKGSLVMKDKQAETTIQIKTVPDNDPELLEKFIIELSNPTGGAELGNNYQRVISIRHNDYPYGLMKLIPPLERTNANGVVEIAEANINIPFTLLRQGGSLGIVSVDMSLKSKTAFSTSPGPRLVLTTLSEAQTTTINSWYSFKIQTQTFFVLLSGHRIAPLATKIGSDGADGPLTPDRVATSVFYRWQGLLKPIQTIETDNAVAATKFSFDNFHYLVIANQGSVSRVKSVVRIYRIHDETHRLTVIQNIEVKFATDITHFIIDNSNLYLLISSYQDEQGKTAVNSQMFKWDPVRRIFGEEAIQSFPTYGAKSVLHFQSNNNHYVMVANYFDSNFEQYDVKSQLYRYDRTKSIFVSQQKLDTVAASDLSYFTVANEIYVAVAQWGGDSGLSSRQLTLNIYKWQAQSFQMYARLTNNGTDKVHTFTAPNGLVYMSTTGPNFSHMYVWDTETSPTGFKLIWTGAASADLLPVIISQKEQSVTLLARASNRILASSSTSEIFLVSMISEKSDFVPSQITMTFMPGETQLIGRVNILDDDIAEDSELFAVKLENPVGGLIISQTTEVDVLILANDNAYGIIEFASNSIFVQVEELQGRVNVQVLNLVRRGGQFGSVVVSWKMSGAHSATDLSPQSGTVEFSEGQSTATISLTINPDNESELDEISTIQLVAILDSGATSKAKELAEIGENSNCTLVVMANDSPYGVVGWTQTNVLTSEPENGDGSIVLVLNREQGLVGELEISYLTSPDLQVPLNQQATANMDYRSSLNTVRMLPNVSRAEVRITILADDVPEMSESFLVKITAVRLVNLNPSSTAAPSIKANANVAKVTISENDNARGVFSFDITESVSGYIIAYEGMGQLTLPIKRTVGIFGVQEVSWVVEPITATNDDYFPSGGTLIFTEGQTRSHINISIVDDSLPEALETLSVKLTRVTGGGVVDTKDSVVVAIIKNDSPYGMFEFDKNPMIVKEAKTAFDPDGELIVKVNRLQGSLGSVSISWQLEPAARSDFEEPYSGNLQFQQGEVTKSFNIRSKPDMILEGEERFTISLILNGTAGDISPTKGDASIIIEADPNAAGVISISPVAVNQPIVVHEPTAQNPKAVTKVQITRGPGIFGKVIIFWSILPRDLNNFVAVDGSVEMANKVSEAFIILEAQQDSIPELTSTYTLRLTGVEPNSAVTAKNGSVATVLLAASNYPFGVFEFLLNKPIIVDEDIGQVEVIVIRRGGREGRVRVSLKSFMGTATAGQDFVNYEDSKLVFAAGQERGILLVSILPDIKPEGPENFYINITGVELLEPREVKAGIDQLPVRGGVNSQEIIIDKNDDAEGFIQFSSQSQIVTVGENVGIASISVSRGEGTFGPVSVQYSSIELSAKANLDYILPEGVLNFQSGQTEGFINVTIIDDDEREFQEQFQINLGTVMGAKLGERKSSIVTIDKSDYPNGLIEFSGETAYSIPNPVEDKDIVLTVTRVGGLIGQQTVRFRLFGPNSETQVLTSTADISWTDSSGNERTEGSLVWPANQGGPITIRLKIKKRGQQWEIAKKFWISIFDTSGLPASDGDAETLPQSSKVSITVEKYGQPNGVIQFDGIALKEDRMFVEPTPDMGTSYEVMFPIKRTQGFEGKIKVHWSAEGPTIDQKPPDFSPTSGTVELADKERDSQIILTILSDNIPEMNEIYKIKLNKIDGGADISDTLHTSTFTIEENDDPRGVFLVNSADQAILLSPDLRRQIRFKVKRMGGLQGEVRVFVRITYDQAVQSVEYISNSSQIQQITFQPDEKEVTNTVDIRNNVFLKYGSSFTISILNVALVNSAVNPKNPPRISPTNFSAKITVPDNAANSEVGFSALTASVNEETDTVSLIMKRLGSYGQLTVEWTPGFPSGYPLPSNIATGSIELTGFLRTVFLAHGESSASFGIKLNPNIERAENFGIYIDGEGALSSSAPGGAVLRRGYTNVLIEPQGVMGFKPSMLSIATNELKTSIVLDVVRKYGALGNIAVQYRTQDFTAQANLDYLPVSSALSFAPGVFQSTIVIEILSDTIPEEQEEFMINLMKVERLPTTSISYESPRLSKIYNRSEIQIRQNNDPYGLLSIQANPDKVNESQSVTLTIRRDGGSLGRVTAFVRSIGGGEEWDNDVLPLKSKKNETIGEILANRYLASRALHSRDYQKMDTQITFNEGETSLSLQFKTLIDDDPELEETALIYLDIPPGSPAAQRPRIAEGNEKDGFKKGYALITIDRNGLFNGRVGFGSSSLAVTVNEDKDPMIRLTIQRYEALSSDVKVHWKAKLSLTSPPADDAAFLLQELENTEGSVICKADQVLCPLNIALKQDLLAERQSKYIIVITSAEPNALIMSSKYFVNVTAEPNDYPDGLIGFNENSMSLFVNYKANEALLTVIRDQGSDGFANITYIAREIGSASYLSGGIIIRRAEASFDFPASLKDEIYFKPAQTTASIRVPLIRQSFNGVEYPRQFQIVLQIPTNGAVLRESRSVANITLVPEEEITLWQLQVPIKDDEPITIDTLKTVLSKLLKFLENLSIINLSGQQFELLEYILKRTNEFIESNGPENSVRITTMSLYCSLMKSGAGSTNAGRTSLAALYEEFAFALLSKASCPFDARKYTECESVSELTIGNLLPEQINGRTFSTSFSSLSNNRPYLTLPKTLMTVLPSGNTCQKIQFIEYKTGIWFQIPNAGKIVGNKAYALTLKDYSGTLLEPITYRIFSENNKFVESGAECAYWATTRWNSDACEVVNRNSLDQRKENFVDCACKHLSVYAVHIAVPDPYYYGYHFSYYIGVGVCLFGMLYAVTTQWCSYQSAMFTTHLHIHFLLACIGFQVLYVINVALSPTNILPQVLNDTHSRCIAIGLVQCFLLLAQFSWILTQCTNLWKILVFNDEHTERRLFVYLLGGWMAPLIWTLVATIVCYVIFLYEFPDIQPEKLFGDINSNGEICFLNNLPVGLVTLALPMLVCVCGSILILIQIWQVEPQWGMYDDIYRGKPNIKELKLLLVFWVILLFQTVFSGLHLVYGHLWWLILFVIFECVQGIFAFLVYGLYRHKWRSCCRPGPGLSYEIHSNAGMLAPSSLGKRKAEDILAHNRGDNGTLRLDGKHNHRDGHTVTSNSDFSLDFKASLINELWDLESSNGDNAPTTMGRNGFAPQIVHSSFANSNFYRTNAHAQTKVPIEGVESNESRDFDQLIYALKSSELENANLTPVTQSSLRTASLPGHSNIVFDGGEEEEEDMEDNFNDADRRMGYGVASIQLNDEQDEEDGLGYFDAPSHGPGVDRSLSSGMKRVPIADTHI